MLNQEPLLEDKVRSILKRDEEVAKSRGRSPYWAGIMEHLQGIKDPDQRNTVFMHTVQSMKYALSLSEATTTAATTPGGYNKAMLPTIIRRVLPQVVATKFVATRQLDVPTQIIQTFRLNRKTAKNGVAAGSEWADPSGIKRYSPTGNTPTGNWQGNKASLDPNFSAQEVVGEGGTTGFSVSNGPHSLDFGPLLPGSCKFSVVMDTDPRDRTDYAYDNGAGTFILSATGMVTTEFAVSSYGLLNDTAPSITCASVTAAGTGYHYEVDYSFSLERNTKKLSEVSFAMDTIQVSAKARKNFAQISAEAIQDLEAYTDGKLDALKELVTAMTETMALEIDQELTLAMMQAAGKKATWDAIYPVGEFRGTQAEWNQTLVHKMNFLSNDMSVDYLRGDDFFAICHPHVFNILQNTNNFKMTDLNHLHQGDFNVSAEKVGTVDNYTIAKNAYHPQSDKMLMGYTSKDLAKAPYAYFPYVTYLTPPQADVMSGDMFSTIVGLQQRYDHKVLLDGQYGLGKLTVTNMYA
ncbi:MAG: hypothetical protein JHC33_10650 [Ignisphaera sp.]|nr:hypothetical protein [Ignisphaera sp.]